MEVRLRQSELERYRVEGRMAPAPYRTEGVIDTAAERTCISTATVDRLLLEPLHHERLMTASGPRDSRVHYLTLQLGPREDHPPDPISVLVYEAAVTGAELLIGLDILRRGKLILDGPSDDYELLLPRSGHPGP